MEPTVSIVIPPLNEEGTIGQLLDHISKLDISETLVIDGGSQDSTIKIVHDKGVKLIQQTCRGWGKAVCNDIQKATSTFIVIVDANRLYSPQEIPTVLKPFTRDHKVGLVVGSRVTRSKRLARA